MRAGYRKFFMFAQVATLIGIGYLMTRFWEDAKKQCELYNLPQKLWVIFGIMFICGIVSWGSVDALTRIYIHKWGMELAFLGYKKKIVWEDFSVIQRYKNHFFFNVSKQGKPYAEIVPERRYYDVRTMTMSEVGLDAGFWGDLYIVMGDNLGKGEFTFRLHYKPLIRWLWLGGILMALGALCSAINLKRKRDE